MKVVINTKIGGFRPSTEALVEYCRIKGVTSKVEETNHGELVVYADGIRLYAWCIDRSDPALVKAIENLGETANTVCSKLKVVEIPDGVEYIVCDNETGVEWIAEKHRTWD